jgi:hypothetical protein
LCRNFFVRDANCFQLDTAFIFHVPYALTCVHYVVIVRRRNVVNIRAHRKNVSNKTRISEFKQRNNKTRKSHDLQGM